MSPENEEWVAKGVGERWIRPSRRSAELETSSTGQDEKSVVNRYLVCGAGATKRSRLRNRPSFTPDLFYLESRSTALPADFGSRLEPVLNYFG